MYSIHYVINHYTTKYLSNYYNNITLKLIVFHSCLILTIFAFSCCWFLIWFFKLHSCQLCTCFTHFTFTFMLSGTLFFTMCLLKCFFHVLHVFTEKKNKANAVPVPVSEQQPVTVTIRDVEPIKGPPAVPPKQLIDLNADDNTPSWRKTLKQTITDTSNKSECEYNQVGCYCSFFCYLRGQSQRRWRSYFTKDQ